MQLGQYRKTTMDRRNLSPAWLYIERRGEFYPLDDYLLIGPRLQILEVRNFQLSAPWKVLSWKTIGTGASQVMIVSHTSTEGMMGGSGRWRSND